MRTAPSEVTTDGSGGPKGVTPEMFVRKCIEQGRIHPDDKAYWLYKFSADEEAAANELLARRPTRTFASERSGMSVSEDSYLTWMRSLGALHVLDDPRVKPSWVR